MQRPTTRYPATLRPLAGPKTDIDRCGATRVLRKGEADQTARPTVVITRSVIAVISVRPSRTAVTAPARVKRTSRTVRQRDQTVRLAVKTENRPGFSLTAFAVSDLLRPF